MGLLCDRSLLTHFSAQSPKGYDSVWDGAMALASSLMYCMTQWLFCRMGLGKRAESCLKCRPWLQLGLGDNKLQKLGPECTRACDNSCLPARPSNVAYPTDSGTFARISEQLDAVRASPALLVSICSGGWLGIVFLVVPLTPPSGHHLSSQELNIPLNMHLDCWSPVCLAAYRPHCLPCMFQSCNT